MKTRAALAVVAVAVCLLGELAGAYSLEGRRWPAGTIVMHLELGAPGTPLIDGSADWDSVAEGALAAWNPFLNGVSFSGRRDEAAVASGDRVNTVSFGDDVFGDPFGSGVLAVTQTFYVPRTNTITEVDVVFNRARNWNAYRGNQRGAAGGGTLFDLRRVALHEFGHVLGLDHPDDHDQSVVAVMNSHVSNVDTLQTDDISGATAIYGDVATTRRDTLPAGASLVSGQSLISANGQFRLVYQADGDLVLFDDLEHTTPWSSGTRGQAAGQASMQADGNFVIYDGSAKARWMTGTAVNLDARLVLQSDGNLVVYTADGRAPWDRSSNPAGFIP